MLSWEAEPVDIWLAKEDAEQAGAVLLVLAGLRPSPSFLSTTGALPSREPAWGTTVLGRQCPPRIPWVLRAQHPGALVLQELPLARASSVKMPSVGFRASKQVRFGAPPAKQGFLERSASKALGSSDPGRLSCCAMRSRCCLPVSVSSLNPIP